eukprot:scaffold310_cov168-Amphora_coffeaeformis.AAC.46
MKTHRQVTPSAAIHNSTCTKDTEEDGTEKVPVVSRQATTTATIPQQPCCIMAPLPPQVQQQGEEERDQDNCIPLEVVETRVDKLNKKKSKSKKSSKIDVEKKSKKKKSQKKSKRKGDEVVVESSSSTISVGTAPVDDSTSEANTVSTTSPKSTPKPKHHHKKKKKKSKKESVVLSPTQEDFYERVSFAFDLCRRQQPQNDNDDDDDYSRRSLAWSLARNAYACQIWMRLPDVLKIWPNCVCTEDTLFTWKRRSFSRPSGTKPCFVWPVPWHGKCRFLVWVVVYPKVFTEDCVNPPVGWKNYISNWILKRMWQGSSGPCVKAGRYGGCVSKVQLVDRVGWTHY